MKINTLRHCVGQLSRFPGIGERTATRLTYWLLQQPPDVAESIGEALQALRQDVVRCSSCCNICSQDPCRLCSDPGRDAGTI
ncbi:MAG: recombination protein RecR, partial [Myxococcota bacterium]|nr:recombination protein RecR [Myxococcota bacterium]